MKAQTAKSRNGKVERRLQGSPWRGRRSGTDRLGGYEDSQYRNLCANQSLDSTFRTIGKTQNHPDGILRAEEAAQEHTGASTAYESLA